MSFMVVQIAPGVHPRDERAPKGGHTGLGVLFPVSLDGFYDNATAAQEVADYMAAEYPTLQTLVVEVVEDASE